MTKIFFAAASLIVFFSCQNTSAPAAKDSQNNRKVVPQKTVVTVKKEKKSLVNDNEIYNSDDVDVRPDYVGGINKFEAFLNKNYIKPIDPQDGEPISGGVFGTVIIEKDGSVSNITILRDIGYGSGKELERVLKLSPNWIPATKDGNPVRCLQSIRHYVLY
ncbi:energy transducer TonB [Flavobacterium procerum]|uniref:Energy transducer TonB n=1 Tax=Flavobacterium procerum TaxID=1455569 RepID=A0ABV6BUW0_9FLAO